MIEWHVSEYEFALKSLAQSEWVPSKVFKPVQQFELSSQPTRLLILNCQMHLHLIIDLGEFFPIYPFYPLQQPSFSTFHLEIPFEQLPAWSQ